jgi:hypothetical protein
MGEFYGILGAIVAGLGAGAVSSLGLRFGVSRFCRKLELRVIDLEQNFISARNRGYAARRWDKAEQFEEEFKKLKLPQAAHSRFANDPIEGDYGLPR